MNVISQHLFISIVLLLVCIPILIIAKKYHYFKLVHPGLIAPQRILLKVVLGAFGICFATQLLLIPAVQYVAYDIYKLFATIPEGVLTKENPSFVAWQRIISLSGGLIALLIYIPLCQIGWDFLWFRSSTESWPTIKAIALGFVTWLIVVPLVNLIGHVGVLIENLISYGVPTSDQAAVEYLKSLQDSPAAFWITAFLFSFPVPLMEEILFRGFLQTRFRCFLSPISAILLTSLIFTLLHFTIEQGLNNIQFLSGLFILSFFIGWLFEKTRNLWASIALHSIFNTISVLMIIFAV